MDNQQFITPPAPKSPPQKSPPKSSPKKTGRQVTISAKKLKKKKAKTFNEESWKEILGFYTNQVDIKKFLPRKKGRQVLGDEKLQDDFLNPNEFAEIKGVYDDYNLGDLVMVFQNPDEEKVNDKAVTFREAEITIDTVLTVMDEGVSKAQMKREKDSFLYAFLTLDDFIPKKKKDEMKKEEEKKKEEKAKEIKEIGRNSNDRKDRSKSIHKSPLNSDPRNSADKNPENRKLLEEPQQKKENLNSYQKYLEFSVDHKKQEDSKKKQKERKVKLDTDLKENLKEQDIKISTINKKEHQLEFADDMLDEEKLDLENELQTFKEELEKLKIQQEELQSEINEILVTQKETAKILVDPIKELLKVDFTDTKIFKTVKKKWSQGGYLTKVMNEGDDYDWVTYNTPPRDFLTLVRFTVMNKLTRNGFLHCRQFVSSTGLHIFLVIKSTRDVIVRQACNMKLNKQIELGYADLFSLEPVDKAFRPLRLKSYLREYATDQDVKNKIFELNEGKTLNTLQGLRPGERVEDHCRAIYPTVCQWTDVELRAYSIRKQLEVDGYIKQISAQLNIDLSHEKVELIDDREISRTEWEAYFIYNEYLACFGETIFTLQEKGHTELKENLAFLFKLIFRKALGDANEFWFDRNYSFFKEITQQKGILYNLWGRLNVDPIAPYTGYFVPITESGKAMWRKYEVNEKGMRSEFINMEKIKLTHAIVLRNINVLKLIKDQMAVAYFPLHDQYQLNGKSKDPFFQPLGEGGLTFKYVETQGMEEVKKLFNQLKDEAESTDFDSDSLMLETQFNYKLPWGVPVASMRDYFGEKLALYFLFLNYYSKQLWYMGFIGLIAQGLMSNADLKGGAIVIYSIAIIIWSTFFIEFWKREQVSFSVQFGQQNFEEAEAERPAFQGRYIRSITTDELNEAFYSPFMRKMKQLISFSVSFLIIICVILSVLGIFTLKNNLIEQGQPALISQTLPSILNSVQIGAFNAVYQILVNIFNIFENHKILTSFEDALIGKIYIFRFVNTFNSFFIIAFLESYFGSLNLCKTSDGVSCFAILETQMSTIFIANVTKYFSVIITPFIVSFIKQKLKKVDEKPIPHPFNNIDAYIENQMELAPYATNDELDGTVNSYMELAVQFSYLVLFGLAFPSAFFLAFFSNVTAIQVDKLQLARFQRRSFPQGAASIGNWLVILEIITFVGIFTNAGLIVFTSESIKSNTFIVFIGLLIFFLVLKYCIRFLVPDEPESALILNKRHAYVVEKVVKGFGSSENKNKKLSKFNSKIGGVAYSNEGMRQLSIIQ